MQPRTTRVLLLRSVGNIAKSGLTPAIESRALRRGLLERMTRAAHAHLPGCVYSQE